MKYVLIALALIGSIELAGAADSTGKYMLLAESCGTYVRDYARGGAQRVESEAWIQGYVSAYNRLMADTYDIRGTTDMPSMMLWLNNYCHKQPLESLEDAMQSLIFELYPRRKRSR
jgi:hypothetical protein